MGRWDAIHGILMYIIMHGDLSLASFALLAVTSRCLPAAVSSESEVERNATTPSSSSLLKALR
jgi:hypothetical protein